MTAKTLEAVKSEREEWLPWEIWELSDWIWIKCFPPSLEKKTKCEARKDDSTLVWLMGS